MFSPSKFVAHSALALVPFVALSPPAIAQSNPETGNEIVVEGQTPQEAMAEAKTYVGKIARSADDQLARFKEPVCPIAAGLPEKSAAWLEARVRAVAEEIGPGQAKPDCRANLVVIATDDVTELFQDIKRHRRFWLEGISGRQRDKLENSVGPIIAWSSTSLRNEDGQRISTQENVESGGSGTDQFSRVMRVNSASIFRLTREQYIDGTIILVDRKALVDRPLLQLADYVAVRGLAQAEPPDNNTIDTVLNAFSPGVSDAPEKITPADYAYLQALYAGNGQMSAVHERARIAKAMAEFASKN